MANNKIFLVVILVIAAFLAFSVYQAGQKTVNEHKTPADISKGESGTGLNLKFYDANGNPIEIPDWFRASSVVDVAGFAIVSHPPAPTCTVVSACAGYATNPNIMCWNSKCVLGNVASIDMGVSVTNPTSSTVSFLNVAPTTALPAAFNTVLSKTVTSILAPGQTSNWATTSPLSVSPWIGTTQTFSVTVAGTNQYSGVVTSVSDSISLAFEADPQGALSVSVISPI